MCSEVTVNSPMNPWTTIKIAAVRHIRLTKITSLTLRQILGTDMHHCAKFEQKRSNVAEITDSLTAWHKRKCLSHIFILVALSYQCMSS